MFSDRAFATRRRLVAAILAGSVLPTILRHWTLLLPNIQVTTQADSARKLVNVFHDKRSAAIVGAEYLRQVPYEADPGCLVCEILAGTPETRRGLLSASLRILRESIRTKQRLDFEEGKVIYLHGWMLSVTEARLCALALMVG